ncbi:LptA/OstA family protein [Phenylobacterium deserti]|uniref:Organic solvent tolerance protein OstA n=1 Tax=Phenylobacterium deserti TaxID=1914756 RepID=A0A328AR22_9CAUL|nr:LptA/OstA family protein [Phenylobacterium deserti]RAK57077.1 organic solvent tolerance protein OstA [Phenylobacterium deserti]
MRAKNISRTKTAIAATALVLLASPALGQQLGQNAKGPVDIAADELVANNNECSSTWRGNVEALQDTARLRSDVLIAIMQKAGSNPGKPGGGCGDLTRMEAKGNVYYVTPQQRVRGDNAVYDAAGETLTITGDVIAVQGQNVLRGGRMVVNTRTGEGQMESAGKGRNRPNRVRGVFYPQQQQASAPAARSR